MRKTISFFLLYAAVTAEAELPVLLTNASSLVRPPAATMTPAETAPASNQPARPFNGYVADQTYKLRAGDTVSFQILEDKILEIQSAPVSLVVADSGELDVPYIGRVMATGKTCKQLAAEIKVALEGNYYKQATVVLSLNLANRMWGRVYVWGEVHNQGALDVQVNENLTAAKAILRAGGFGDFANKRKVKVVRADPGRNGESKIFDLDMTQILDQGKIKEDILLQPGDLIIVPSRLINF